MATAIDVINDCAKSIADGKHETITPGQTVRLSEAASVGDFVRQGDLYLIVVDAVPAGYENPERPSRQLVPGNTDGAKHCLDSLAGVSLFLPPNWSDESLDGPVLVLAKERTVGHPTHGEVTIPAGFTVQCRYQREYDAEQRRERRNAD